MNAKDAILQSISISEMVMGKYLEDLADEAFFVRPVAGMNTIAWQVGHLISSEKSMVEAIKPGSCPELPAGFEATHGKEGTTVDDPSKFATKAEYLTLWKAQKAATLAAIESASDADLDAPSPEPLRAFGPTAGHIYNLTGLHTLMHLGQFVPVRREQGMPIVF